MLILHSYTKRRYKSQSETWQALHNIEKEFPDYVVIHKEMKTNTDYWKFLAENWAKDDIINVEQDIVPGPKHIQDLVACRYQACSVPYQLPDNRLSVWTLTGDDANIFFKHKEDLPGFTEASSIGLVKIGLGLQFKIPIDIYPVEQMGWWALDGWISTRMALHNYQWHLHLLPLQHKHTKLSYNE